MSKAWIYQDDKQVKKRTAAKASWYVGFYDLDGKRRCESCGPGAMGKNLAQKRRRKLESELTLRTYQSSSKKTWPEFRQKYEADILGGKDPATRRLVRDVFKHFERIVNPKKLATLKTGTIDTYRSKRRMEPGKRKGDLVSPATVNKELRHLRAALKKAYKWGYLPGMPDFEFERQPEKFPVYVTPEHFARIYSACDQARQPAGQGYPAADWWRALLVMAYMTGWRIGELLALHRGDLDLAAETAITRHGDNKGKRDERARLHSIVVQHLVKLAAFGDAVFPWNRNMRALYEEFARIQEAAKIKLPCPEVHTHSRFCYLYGFHDLRRAFATMNADRLTGDALKSLMRHKSYQTTQRYINMARQIDPAVASLYVPELPKQKSSNA